MQKNKITFDSLKEKDKELLIEWLKKPHIADYLYGQGLQNTLNDIDEFLNNKGSFFKHWIAYFDGVPFGYLLTSEVSPDDEYAKWIEGDIAITLDVFIGEE